MKNASKGKSLSSQIKNLRLRLKIEKSNNNDYWEKIYELRTRLYDIEKITPKKYYKIDFKIKANNGDIVNSSEVLWSYSAELAIEKVKSDKIHPDTFVLLDIKLLA